MYVGCAAPVARVVLDPKLTDQFRGWRVEVPCLGQYVRLEELGMPHLKGFNGTFLKYGRRPSQLHSDFFPKYDPQRS